MQLMLMLTAQWATLWRSGSLTARRLCCTVKHCLYFKVHVIFKLWVQYCVADFFIFFIIGNQCLIEPPVFKSGVQDSARRLCWGQPPPHTQTMAAEDRWESQTQSWQTLYPPHKVIEEGHWSCCVSRACLCDCYVKLTALHIFIQTDWTN